MFVLHTNGHLTFVLCSVDGSTSTGWHCLRVVQELLWVAEKFGLEELVELLSEALVRFLWDDGILQLPPALP